MINGSVELEWGDGKYLFNVAISKYQFELEDKCDAGIFEIYHRVMEKKAYRNDIVEPIRLGLIGGGRTPIQALTLINRYIEGRPLAEHVLSAQLILMAAIVGIPGDEAGKKPGADQTESQATPASSDPPSTGLEPPSGLVPDRLTKSPSGSFAPASTDGTKSTERTSRPSR